MWPFKPSARKLINQLASGDAKAFDAAKLLAKYRYSEAVPSLASIVGGDSRIDLVKTKMGSGYVHQEAARALAAIGTSEARDAILQAMLTRKTSGTGEVLVRCINQLGIVQEARRLTIFANAKGVCLAARLGSDPKFSNWSFCYKFLIAGFATNRNEAGGDLDLQNPEIYHSDGTEMYLHELTAEQLRNLIEFMGNFRDRPYGSAPKPGLSWAGVHIRLWQAAYERLKDIEGK